MKKAVTLIELITVIIIMSLAIPSLIALFTQANLNTVFTDFSSAGLFYAEEMMEEIKSKRFDENTESPWSTNLGPDTSTTGLDGVTPEDNTDHRNWDDVDDYNGYTDNPTSLYVRSVTVEYEELNGTNWQPASSSPTDYKKIIVSVARKDGIGGTITLTTLVSGY